jgi:hypothetical protein
MPTKTPAPDTHTLDNLKALHDAAELRSRQLEALGRDTGPLDALVADLSLLLEPELFIVQSYWTELAADTLTRATKLLPAAEKPARRKKSSLPPLSRNFLATIQLRPSTCGEVLKIPKKLTFPTWTTT